MRWVTQYFLLQDFPETTILEVETLKKIMSTAVEQEAPSTVSITPLLRRLWPSPGESNVSASEIAYAISHIFTDSLSPVQTGALLTCLHFTGWDRKADVLAKCAESMREAALPVDLEALNKVVKAVGRPEGNYKGGLVRKHYWEHFTKVF
jgi:anthranilate phosphoribosyltransferase